MYTHSQLNYTSAESGEHFECGGGVMHFPGLLARALARAQPA